MSNCYHCKIEIKAIPNRCKFCGMIYCHKHRLPENHNCPFDLIKKNKDKISLNKSQVLYQDALEYLNKELTVAKIYEYLTTKQIPKSEAVNLLCYLMENSENSEIRKICILAFEVLELNDDKAYDILESYFLSDEDSDVKKTALRVVTTNFPKKSKKLLMWLSENKDKLKGNKN
ncbi:MAG: hypothetical protein JSV62_01075 [Promethearchaeota archaeon]|nr:MAG: hypothetical protein JSV62_01075 [Candidatus Lokiarchaeota archaeon]